MTRPKGPSPEDEAPRTRCTRPDQRRPPEAQAPRGPGPHRTTTSKHPHVKLHVIRMEGCEQIRKTQDEPQWIVAQRLLSALTIPGFS